MSVSVNGETAIFAAIGKNIISFDERISVSGINGNGDVWYQLAINDKEMEEPYLQSYGYKKTLQECTSENHNSPQYAYKWIYRCLAQNFETQERILFCDGVTTKTTEINRQDDEETGHILIPFSQFPDIESEYAVKILKRVIADNHFIAFPYIGIYNGCLMCSTATTSTAYSEMLRNVDLSVTAIGQKIEELYGYTPSNQPIEVDAKVKVAKVIWDWLKLNNTYNGNDTAWKSQTVYSALSGSVNDPVCASYARAAHKLLEKYGIESVLCSGYLDSGGIGHQWLMVNYHDTIGDYTEDASKWCIFDATGNSSGTITSWANFNRTHVEGRYLLTEEIYSYPTTTPMDGEHTYGGKLHYAW